MTNVLITGARAPVALDLARCFEAAGLTPQLADSIRPRAASWSRVGRGRMHRYASPRFAYQRFKTDFARLVSRLDPVLVLPTCEEVFYVAQAASELGILQKIFAPEPELLRKLHSKVEFATLAACASIASPETYRVTSAAELGEFRGRSTTLVFKPEFSRFATRALIRPKMRELDSLSPSQAEPWAVQEFVDGDEICVWSAAREGELVAFAAYRPRWRVAHSSSFYFETEPDGALIKMAREIARHSSATGQLSFDVIRRADGTIVPIECNPRSVSGIHLFDASPGLARAILDKSDLVTPDAAARHIGPAMWLLGLPNALASAKVSEFRRDLRSSCDVLSADRRQRRGALIDAAHFALMGFRKGISAAAASTYDIEWNGQAIG